MAVAVQSVSTNAPTGAAGTLAITKPTGVVDGDLLLAFMAVANAVTLTPPADWNVRHTGTAGTGDIITYWIGWREAASEGADYTWSWTEGNREACGGILRIDGQHATSPIDASAVTASATEVTNTIDAPAATATVANTLVARFAAHDRGGGFDSIPTTSRWNLDTGGTGGVSSGCSSAAQAGTGTTGTATFPWTVATDLGAVGATVVIAPAAAGGVSVPALDEGMLLGGFQHMSGGLS